MSISFVYDGYGNRKYLDQSERRAFLGVATQATPEVKTFCMVLAYTGARISEVLALTPARVDFDASVIVYESLKKRSKGQYRAVPVPLEVLQTLEAVHCLKKLKILPAPQITSYGHGAEQLHGHVLKRLWKKRVLSGLMIAPRVYDIAWEFRQSSQECR